jgi:hypothetical protein
VVAREASSYPDARARSLDAARIERQPASKERGTILCWVVVWHRLWPAELQGGGVTGVAKSRCDSGVPWSLSLA